MGFEFRVSGPQESEFDDKFMVNLRVPILFWGFLIIVMVAYTPRPYSNYKSPYITKFRDLGLRLFMLWALSVCRLSCSLGFGVCLVLVVWGVGRWKFGCSLGLEFLVEG